MTTTKDPLAPVLKEIEAAFGKGVIQTLGSKEIVPVEAISTSSLALDEALGIGGVARGRVCEIYGRESTGKTSLIYHLIANAQAAGGRCAFIDTEHALDPAYAQRLGVNTDDLLISQPDFGEQALEIVDRLTNTGELALIAIDSVDAITPRAILEGEMGESTVGLLARLMSQALRKLAPAANRSGTAVVFTNQIRDNINTLGFGPKEFQPGGRALKFYASQRIDLRRIETVTQGDEAVGIRVKAKVVKNKVARPYQVAELEIDFGEGVSRSGELLDRGLTADFVELNGSWFSFGDTRLGQGRTAAKTFLRENLHASEALEQRLREAS